MEKNKSRMGVAILIGVLAALVVVLTGYIVYDKIIHKDSNIQSTNQDTEKILYRIEKNKDNSTSKLIVNNKEVAIPQFNSEVITQIKDALLVKSYSFDEVVYYFVDKNANVIKEIVGSNVEVVNIENTITLKGGYIGICTVENDTLTCHSDEVAPEPVYRSCNHKSDDIVEYIEKFSYLGNGKFTTPTVIKTITAKEYIADNNITCNFTD